MNLNSTRGDDHLSFAADEIKVAILIKPANVARRHSIVADERCFGFAVGALEVGGCNSMFTNGNDLAIRCKLDAYSGEQLANRPTPVGAGHVECNATKLGDPVSLK